jgi:hypothetical protein
MQLLAMFQSILNAPKKDSAEQTDPETDESKERRWLSRFLGDAQAWNLKRADEPHYKKRLEAMAACNAVLRDGGLDGVPLSIDVLHLLFNCSMQFLAWVSSRTTILDRSDFSRTIQNHVNISIGHLQNVRFRFKMYN